MAGPWEKFAPVSVIDTDGPWTQFAEPEPQAPPDPIDQIDFTADRKDVRRAISALPKERRQEAIRRWQENRVQRERAQARESTLGTVGMYIGDTIGQLGRGASMGYSDELNAATSAALGALGSDAPPEAREAMISELYDENLEYNRALGRAQDDESTSFGEFPLIGEVTAGGATKLAGGALTALALPMLNVFRGGALLSRAGNLAATGAGYGALAGFGEGEGGVENRAGSAALGAGVGGLVGGAAAPVAAGAGNALTYLAAQARRTPEALRGYNRGAVRRVAESASADFPEGQISNVVTRDGRRIELGDEATLADMGMNLRQDAAAIANQPGRGQAIITRTLDDRRGGAETRIDDQVTESLGERVNIPRMSEAMQADARAQAAPLYETFYNTEIPITGSLMNLMRRASATGAVNRARRLMAQEGVQPRMLDIIDGDAMSPLTGVLRVTGQQRLPNGREVDLIKRAIDDEAMAATPGSNEQRILRDLARRIRNEVDSLLSPDDPAQSVWAQARRIAGDDISFREAMEEGAEAFRRGVTPDEFEMTLERSTPAQREARLIGVRGDIQEQMGNRGSAFGPRADVGARQMFGSQNARRKLEMAVGPERAGALVNRLDAEGVMDATRQQVLQNSQTAARQAAQQRFPSPIAGDRAAVGLRNTSIPGIIFEGAARIANALRGGAINEQRMAVAEDAARMLMAQGASRRQIVDALQEYIGGQRMNEDMRRALIEILSRAGVATSIGAASNATSAQ